MRSHNTDQDDNLQRTSLTTIIEEDEEDSSEHEFIKQDIENMRDFVLQE